MLLINEKSNENNLEYSWSLPIKNKYKQETTFERHIERRYPFIPIFNIIKKIILDIIVTNVISTPFIAKIFTFPIPLMNWENISAIDWVRYITKKYTICCDIELWNMRKNGTKLNNIIKLSKTTLIPDNNTLVLFIFSSIENLIIDSEIVNVKIGIIK